MLKPLQLDDQAPWKQRFRAQMIGWSQLAHGAPSRGLVGGNSSGVGQLYAWDIPTNGLKQLTNIAHGIKWGVIAPDGRYVYYFQDTNGDEIGHVVRIPFEGGVPEDITPELPPYPTLGFAMSRSGNCLVLIVANSQGYQFYRLGLGSQGELVTRQLLYQSAKLTMHPGISASGAIAIVTVLRGGGLPQSSLCAIDATTGDLINEVWDGPGSAINSALFAPIDGDERLVATTNRTGVNRPFIWNPRTGERVELALDQLEFDVDPVAWSPSGQALLLCQSYRATQQLYLYDLEDHTCRRLNHPQGVFWSTYFEPGGTIWTQWADSAHPPQLIALDGATGTYMQTLLGNGAVPPGRPWRSITFQSTDQQTVQGWLGLPDGTGPFPTIIHLHGGPVSVVTDSFSPESQLWLDHGFAFLSINYRGSTTFGRDFANQIWGDVGHWELEDIVAARDWLISQGIAISDQIVLTGWSYGGYLTLFALGKRPDLWAGGIAGTAIADWTMQFEDSAATLKGLVAGLFGGTPADKPAQYAQSSPLTYVEQVQVPVLILQGRNDTRCPARPMELYVDRLQHLGKTVEIHWFDAGHSGLVAEREIQHHELMLRFAERILA